jgi:hypothetical protein
MGCWLLRRAFDDVRGAEMLPVLGREVVCRRAIRHKLRANRR